MASPWLLGWLWLVCFSSWGSDMLFNTLTQARSLADQYGCQMTFDVDYKEFREVLGFNVYDSILAALERQNLSELFEELA